MMDRLQLGALVRKREKARLYGPVMAVVRLQTTEEFDGLYVETEFDTPYGKHRNYFSGLDPFGGVAEPYNDGFLGLAVVGFPEGFTPDLFAP